jgi:hypothetical protein
MLITLGEMHGHLFANVREGLRSANIEVDLLLHQSPPKRELNLLITPQTSSITGSCTKSALQFSRHCTRVYESSINIESDYR